MVCDCERSMHGSVTVRKQNLFVMSHHMYIHIRIVLRNVREKNQLIYSFIFLSAVKLFRLSTVTSKRANKQYTNQRNRRYRIFYIYIKTVTQHMTTVKF